MNEDVPWQLKMFQKTLKKKLRLKALRKHIRKLEDAGDIIVARAGEEELVV